MRRRAPLRAFCALLARSLRARHPLPSERLSPGGVSPKTTSPTSARSVPRALRARKALQVSAPPAPITAFSLLTTPKDLTSASLPAYIFHLSFSFSLSLSSQIRHNPNYFQGFGHLGSSSGGYQEWGLERPNPSRRGVPGSLRVGGAGLKGEPYFKWPKLI